MFLTKMKTVAALVASLIVASMLLISSLARPVRSEQGAAVARGLANDVAADPPRAVAAPQPKGETPRPTVETVKQSRLRRMTSQPGTVIAFESVDLYSRVSGWLSKLNVDIGHAVKRGDNLATISDPDGEVAIAKSRVVVERSKRRVAKAQAAVVVAEAAAVTERARVEAPTAALEQSEARVKFRKKELERIRDLRHRNAVEERIVDETANQVAAAEAGLSMSRSSLLVAKATEEEARAKIAAARVDLEEFEGEVRIAEADLHQAQIHASYTSIVSPFDGIVTRRNYHVGAFVRSAAMGNGEPILTIVKTGKMRFVVNVPDREVPFLDPGDPVTVQIDALAAHGVYQGKIARTAYALNASDRTLRAEIDLDNADGRLRPGLFGRVTIILEDRDHVLAIPSAAIVEQGGAGEAECYGVVDGRAVRTRMKVGQDDGVHTEVVEGLKEGDAVVANPEIGITDGQVIAVKKGAGVNKE
jgi:RND family efflux transporter MFP subunit